MSRTRTGIRTNPPLTAEGKRVIAEYTAGTSVEMKEHGGPWHKAAKIAVQHLDEDDHYYTKLRKVFPEEGQHAAAEVAKIGLRFNPRQATRQPARPRNCTCGMKFTCDECRGRGRDPSNPARVCDSCDGAGAYERVCPVHGHGHYTQHNTQHNTQHSQVRPNPYRTEHAARQIDPGQFKSFGRKTVFHGSGDNRKAIYFVIGGYAGKAGSAVQSVRFPVEQWTVDQAKEWLRGHGMSDVVEPAVPYAEETKQSAAKPSQTKQTAAKYGQPMPPVQPKQTPTEKERNPYSTGEHSALIIQQTSQYNRFTESAIQSAPDGNKNVKFVLGWKGKDPQPDIVYVRFPANEWTKEQAVVWLKQHNMPSYVTPADPDTIRCIECRHVFKRDPNLSKIIDQYTCPECGKVPPLSEIPSDVDRAAAWKQKQAVGLEKRAEEMEDRRAKLDNRIEKARAQAKAEGVEFNVAYLNQYLEEHQGEDEDDTELMGEDDGSEGEEGSKPAEPTGWVPKPPTIR